VAFSFSEPAAGQLGGSATIVPGGLVDTFSSLFANNFPRWESLLNNNNAAG